MYGRPGGRRTWTIDDLPSTVMPGPQGQLSRYRLTRRSRSTQVKTPARSQKRLDPRSASEVGPNSEVSARLASRSTVVGLVKSPIGVTQVSEIPFAPVVEARSE